MSNEYEQPHVHEHVATKTEASSGVSESALNDLLCLDDLDAMEKEAKIEFLDDAIHRLNFERRLASLSEKQHDESLSKWQHEKIDACKTEKDRDDLFNNYARTMYFRRCMWIDYLNGSSDDAPVEA